MAQAILVENQIDDGSKILEQLRSKNIDVTAAFWLKPIDDERWYFYIALQAVDDKGLAAAYREINAAIQNLQNLWIDLFQLKLIGANDPIAKDVLRIRDRGGAPLATRVRGYKLGEVYIDEAYIYPPLSNP
jgi:hypothetical protein